ncbi:hypothetical protein BC834DRAFT_400 [Gloeopeniophorella convolvens]|nr:hypothetical protein BC834DRAFT_400 [Gloeopeniophorella convolvens]
MNQLVQVAVFRAPRDGHRSIHDVPDEILLEIFDYHRIGCNIPWNYIDRMAYAAMDLSPWWYTLGTVCRRWRQVIRASPHRLDIKLQYMRGVSVKSMLENAPSSYPLVINFPRSLYFRKLDTPGLKLVIQQTERFREATLHASGPAFAQLISVMTFPAPRLERLTLVNEDGITIPDNLSQFPPAFLGGHAPNLGYVDLGNIAIPDVPRWLSSATNLISLYLSRVKIPLEILLAILQGASQLKILNVSGWHFSDLTSSSRHHNPTSPPGRIKLHALESFHFLGPVHRLEGIASMIDARPSTTSFHTWTEDADPLRIPHSLELFAAPSLLSDKPFRLEFSPPTQARLSIPGSETTESSIWSISYSNGSPSVLSPASTLCRCFSGILMNARVLYVRATRLQEIDGFSELDATDWRPVIAPFVNASVLGITDVLQVTIGKVLDCCTEGGPLEGSLPALRKVVVIYDKKLKRRTVEQKQSFNSYIAKQRGIGREVEVSHRVCNWSDRWWE